MPIKDDVVIGKRSKIWHPELVNIYGCTIGNNTTIGAFCEIRGDVVIGDNCKLQAFVFIPEGVVIGNNVFIGPHVCFTNDKYPSVEGDWERLSTIIKDNVSIGAAAVICPGIVIESGAVIGAGSVVTKNVQKNTVIMGNPARITRKGE